MALSDVLPTDSLSTVVSVLALLPAVAYLYYKISQPSTASPQPSPSSSSDSTSSEKKEETKSIMQPPRTDIDPPKDDPFTLEQLKEFDGNNADKPVYVAIKGTVFDVSNKRETYGKGGSYNLFAGKDASKALGKSSLKEEDASPDYSTLDSSERQVLDDWHAFFTKRYNIVGKVTDLPPAVSNL